MQSYSERYAKVYNELWTGFATSVAPRLRAFYEMAAGPGRRTLIDLGCGTGQLCHHFLENGYSVLGVDLSDAMLEHARTNAAEFIRQGRGRFVQGDITAFRSEERFGLALSTFDVLNHLPDLARVNGFLESVSRAVLDGGMLIFDVLTAKGMRLLNSISMEDTGDYSVTTGGAFDQHDRGLKRIAGFWRAGEHSYERFEEVIEYRAFVVQELCDSLRAFGWSAVWPALFGDLGQPVSDPEKHSRIWIVAKR